MALVLSLLVQVPDAIRILCDTDTHARQPASTLPTLPAPPSLARCRGVSVSAPPFVILFMIFSRLGKCADHSLRHPCRGCPTRPGTVHALVHVRSEGCLVGMKVMWCRPVLTASFFTTTGAAGAPSREPEALYTFFFFFLSFLAKNSSILTSCIHLVESRRRIHSVRAYSEFVCCPCNVADTETEPLRCQHTPK